MGHPAGAEESHSGLGEGELRILRRHDEIAIQRELAAAAHGVSVNGADDGLGHRLHVDRHLLDLVHERADLGDVSVTQGRLLEVVARTERPALAGEDDDPDGRVARGGLECFVQVPHELGHHRVEAVRPVETNTCETVSHVVEHGFQRHGFASAR